MAHNWRDHHMNTICGGGGCEWKAQVRSKEAHMVGVVVVQNGTWPTVPVHCSPLSHNTSSNCSMP